MDAADCVGNLSFQEILDSCRRKLLVNQGQTFLSKLLGADTVPAQLPTLHSLQSLPLFEFVEILCALGEGEKTK